MFNIKWVVFSARDLWNTDILKVLLTRWKCLWFCTFRKRIYWAWFKLSFIAPWAHRCYKGLYMHPQKHWQTAGLIPKLNDPTQFNAWYLTITVSHSFIQQINTHCVFSLRGAILVSGKTVLLEAEDQNPCPHGTHIPTQERSNQSVSQL